MSVYARRRVAALVRPALVLGGGYALASAAVVLVRQEGHPTSDRRRR